MSSSFAFTLPVLAVSMLTSAAAQAQTAAPVRLEQPAAQSLRVRISNPSLRAGTVRVLSAQSGRMLFTNRYKAAAYGHRFEFRELPVGRYTLLVQVAGQRYRYNLHLRGDQGLARTLEVSPTSQPASITGL